MQLDGRHQVHDARDASTEFMLVWASVTRIGGYVQKASCKYGQYPDFLEQRHLKTSNPKKGD